MNFKPRVQLERLRARLDPLLAAARTHRFWIECSTLTLLGLVAALSSGLAALERAEALRERTAETGRVRRAMVRWTTELHPPTPRESLAWRESERMLLALGVEAEEPLSLARLISQRAEEVGVADVRIRLASGDSLVTPPPLEAGSVVVESGPHGLVVDFSGSMSEVIGFLGSLPPQVRVGSMRVTAEDPGVRASVVLLARRPVPRG
jgi:hypothetical protein